ncbi:ATP-binding protein, partial [Halorubrum sp. SD626R]
ISIERDLAESLAHEDLSPTELRNRINTLPSGEWIAQLPSPSFGETGPPPFSLKPLPIAPGHPESDQPLTEPQEDHFESVSRPRMVEQTQAQYGLTEPTESNTAPEETGWGSSGAETTGSAADGDSGTDPTQSAFISESTTEDASMSTTQPETDSDPDADEAAMSPLFGQTTETDEEPTGYQATQPENGATPVQESSVPVPDDELQQRGLSRDDVRFLNRVLDVMNREDDEYTLLDRMSQLRDEYDGLHVERLTEQDLLEADSAAGRKYYTILPDGRDLLGKELKAGPGAGDLGEKTPHKVGVRLLELWLQQRDDVGRVEPYYETEDGTVLDVAGFDEDGELVWAGEAELASNNRHAPVEDYDKLSAVDADAIWAFNNRETARDVLDSLADADRIGERVSGRAARSFATIRDAVDEFDAAGLTTVRGFKNLDQELNQ